MSKVLKPLSFVLCLLSSRGEGQRTDDKVAPRPPTTGKMPVVPVAGETPATPILGARRAGRSVVKRRELRFPKRTQTLYLKMTVKPTFWIFAPLEETTILHPVGRFTASGLPTMLSVAPGAALMK